MNQTMLEQVRSGRGFVAALDQSGGSTPKALAGYGIPESAYSDDSGARCSTWSIGCGPGSSPARRSAGNGSWPPSCSSRRWTGRSRASAPRSTCGTASTSCRSSRSTTGSRTRPHGAQVLKPIPDLADLLARATGHGVFGTKMRSVILTADRTGIDAVVGQQFDLAGTILDAGLVPIIEPEVDIHSPDKAATEALLKATLLARLDRLPAEHEVMLKLTLPEVDGFHRDLQEHPRVLRVVALSGGYSREEADARLARNAGLIASFSRALTEGLTAQMSDTEFDAALDASIASIYAASTT